MVKLTSEGLITFEVHPEVIEECLNNSGLCKFPSGRAVNLKEAFDLIDPKGLAIYKRACEVYIAEHGRKGFDYLEKNDLVFFV